MLGLTALEHTLKPETTLEKIFFLVEYGVTRAHRPTSFISACALASLVTLRMLKASLRQYKWVARVPEVLIVVIVSTSTICALALFAQWLNSPQFCRMSSVGIMMALPFSAMCRSIQVASLSSSLSPIIISHT
jgi:hypothetical protein